MFMRSAGYVFILAMLVGGCAQSPSKNPLPDAVSETGGSPGAMVDDAVKETVIEQIMAESGWNEMIKQMPAMAAMGFDQQQPPPINRDEYEKFRTALLQTFDVDRMRETIVAYLAERYDHQRYSAFLALLRTPLAQKMTALEIEANTPQAQQEMMQMGNIIMGQASPRRLELVRRLDAVTVASETALDVELMIAGAMMRNMNKIAPPGRRMSEAQLDQMLTQMRMQSIFPVRQFTHLNMVYAYRSVSDKELAQYLQLHESEAGRWGTALMRDALMELSAYIAADLAERVRNTFIESNAL